MFYPRSVAIVGASAKPDGSSGANYLSRLNERSFPGGIYPVNPNAAEIQGLKSYPDVKSLPELVDLAIIAVPAPRVPEVLEDCIATGVKNVHIYSSGFSETREDEGQQLEERITEITKKGGLRVVGPNCMGLYVPASKLVAWGTPPTASGPVAFISQSGGHSEFFIKFAPGLGIHFSKVVSFGNACGLQVLDFLEYLADDPETGIITMYLEDIKDGGRATRLIRDINRIKPVIIWKGGLTDSGSRAVASHTGSLAGEEMVWRAFFAQTGAVRVDSLEEIADVVIAFLHLVPPHGRRTLVLGSGGGNSVEMADICGREGLEVPPLSYITRKELASFIRLAGNIIRNPLDISQAQEDIDLLRHCLDLVVADPVIDLAIFDRHVGNLDDNHPGRERRRSKVSKFIIDVIKKNTYDKPLVVSMKARDLTPNSAALGARLRREFASAGIPAYSSQATAAKALARYIKYHEFRAVSGEGN